MSRLNCYRCDDRTVSAFPFVLIIFFVVSTVWPGGEVPSFAQEIDPEQLNRSMNWFHNAKHHHELGEDEKALVCLDKALEIYPGNPEANELLNFIKSGGQKPAVSPEGDGTAEEQTPKMKKACVINLKVLGGGLEMYDMDREGGESIPEGPVTAGSQLGETLLNEGYVKKVPVCPGGGTYIHRGNCSVYCTVHGEDDLVVTGDDLLPLLDGDLNGLAGPTPEAAEADPQSLSPKEALKKAGLLIREGQLSAALPFAQAANEGLDSSAVSLNVLGYIHEKLGVLDEAIRYYQKAMEKEPDN
ncbi:MAG: tetratricopeptide repeat protein, partial [bacterium]|nr:tetratricopeptide repeat protein [bacterium]